MWQRFWMAIARKQKELWWSICFILLLFLLFNFLSFYLFWWFWWWSWLQPHEQGRQFFLFSFCFFVGILNFLSYFLFFMFTFCFIFVVFHDDDDHDCTHTSKVVWQKGERAKPLQHFFSRTNLRSSSISVHFCRVLIVFFNVSFNCIFLYFSCFHLFIVL